MKTHFNKWRSFLVEQENKTTKELERKFYGTDIEDLAESLYSTYLRISESEYNTVEENAIRTLEEIEGKFIFKQIKVLGSGSWRLSFSIDDDFIIKINHDDSYSGRQMNKDDARLGTMGDISEFFPRVYSHDPEYKWIVMEKGQVIKRWDEMLTFFPNRLLLPYEACKGKYTYMSLFNDCLYYNVGIKSKKSHYVNYSLETDNSANILSLLHEKEENKLKFPTAPKISLLAENFKYPLYVKLVNAISEFDIEPEEVRPYNTGIGKDGRFLLIDSSIRETILA